MTPAHPAALPSRGCSIHADRRTSCWPADAAFLGCLTFELRGRQRQAARPWAVKMYGVPPARAWRPAAGARLARTLGIREMQSRWASRKCACRREWNSHEAAKPLEAPASSKVISRWQP